MSDTGVDPAVHPSERRSDAVQAHAAEHSRLLRALPVAEYGRMLTQFTPVGLRLRQGLVVAHAPIARVARWLLMTHDRVHGAEFDLTHEFRATMLGVRCAGVTVTMGALQRAELVRDTRGRVTVLDRARLEQASCTCYAIMRAAAARVSAVPVA